MYVPVVELYVYWAEATAAEAAMTPKTAAFFMVSW